MLYAEVRAFETQKGTAEQSEDKVAFALHRVKKGRVAKRRDEGRDDDEWDGHWDGYDAKKFCVYCRFKGHDVKECYKSLWKKQIAEGPERSDRSGKSIEWNFNGQGQGQGQRKFIGWDN